MSQEKRSSDISNANVGELIDKFRKRGKVGPPCSERMDDEEMPTSLPTSLRGMKQSPCSERMDEEEVSVVTPVPKCNKNHDMHFQRAGEKKNEERECDFCGKVLLTMTESSYICRRERCEWDVCLGCSVPLPACKKVPRLTCSGGLDSKLTMAVMNMVAAKLHETNEAGANAICVSGLALALALVAKGTNNANDHKRLAALVGAENVEDLYDIVDGLKMSSPEDGLFGALVLVMPDCREDYKNAVIQMFEKENDVTFMSKYDKQIIDGIVDDKTNGIIKTAPPLPKDHVNVAGIMASVFGAGWKIPPLISEDYKFRGRLAGGMQFKNVVTAWEEEGSLYKVVAIPFEVENSVFAFFVQAKEDSGAIDIDHAMKQALCATGKPKHAIVPTFTVQGQIDIKKDCVGDMNLPNIAPHAELTVFTQQLKMKVDKDGAVAVAVTTVGACTRGAPASFVDKTQVITIDDFFYFVIGRVDAKGRIILEFVAAVSKV